METESRNSFGSKVENKSRVLSSWAVFLKRVISVAKGAEKMRELNLKKPPLIVRKTYSRRLFHLFQDGRSNNMDRTEDSKVDMTNFCEVVIKSVRGDRTVEFKYKVCQQETCSEEKGCLVRRGRAETPTDINANSTPKTRPRPLSKELVGYIDKLKETRSGLNTIKGAVENLAREDVGFEIKRELVDPEEDRDMPDTPRPLLEIPTYALEESFEVKEEEANDAGEGPSGTQGSELDLKCDEESVALDDLRPRNVEEDGLNRSRLFAIDDNSIGLYPTWSMFGSQAYDDPDPKFQRVFDPALKLRWSKSMEGRVCYNLRGNIMATIVDLHAKRCLRVDPDGALLTFYKNLVGLDGKTGPEISYGLSRNEVQSFSHCMYTCVRFLLHPMPNGALSLHCTLIKKLGTAPDEWGTVMVNPECRACRIISTPRRLLVPNESFKFDESEDSFYLDSSLSDASQVDYSIQSGTFTLHSSRSSYQTAASNASWVMPELDYDDPKTYCCEAGRKKVEAARAAPLPNLEPAPVPEVAPAMPPPAPQGPSPRPIRRQPLRRVRLERLFQERQKTEPRRDSASF